MKVTQFIKENPNKRIEVFDGAISYSLCELNEYLLNASITKIKYNKPDDTSVRRWARDLYTLFI